MFASPLVGLLRSFASDILALGHFGSVIRQTFGEFHLDGSPKVGCPWLASGVRMIKVVVQAHIVAVLVAASCMSTVTAKNHQVSLIETLINQLDLAKLDDEFAVVFQKEDAAE